ncbi:MAG: DUF721 domain-containing protein [Muribaculaceae bacterium]|nr:DUF721 domain-containing protein [Muribaculaceae bacterium]
MKKTYPKQVREIIDSVLRESDDAENFLRQQACFLWVETVGPVINSYTYRRYVEGSVLHVYLTSASLKNELSFHRSSIVESINKSLGKNVLTELIIH